MGVSKIVRQPSNRSSNTVDPNRVQIPSTLDRNPQPGISSLVDGMKQALAEESPRIVENAVVLELVGPQKWFSGQTKYDIAHLNLKKPLEGLLIKAYDPVNNNGIPNPLDDYMKSIGAASPKEAHGESTATKDQKQAKLIYYHQVATLCNVFAPLPTNSFFSTSPEPGSKVRLYYFQNPTISSGETIAGYYERMQDDDSYIPDPENIKESLSKYRQKFIKVIQQILINNASNVSEVAESYGDDTFVPSPSSDLVIGNVKDTSWPPIDVIAEYIGDPANPNAILYAAVVQQFEVETNPRYAARDITVQPKDSTTQKKDTEKKQIKSESASAEPTEQQQTIDPSKLRSFCDIYVADVTLAMGLPVPWVVDNNNDPQPMASAITNGFKQLNVDGMHDWLLNKSLKYDWREVTAEEARDNANKGLLTIASTPSNLAIVIPGDGSTTKDPSGKDIADPVCSQAGLNGASKLEILISEAFGENKPQYFTCYRTSRYSVATPEQLERLRSLLSTLGVTVPKLTEKPITNKIRDFIAAMSESEKYDFFSTFIPKNQGVFRTDVNVKNVVGFRRSTSTHANSGRGFYDDLFFIIWKNQSGQKRVTQHIGNTDPSTYYLAKNKSQNDGKDGRYNGKLDIKFLGRLRPGFYIYTTADSENYGKCMVQKGGTYVAIERDVDDNGYFDDNSVKTKASPSMLFHGGGRNDGEKGSTFVGSAGCQTFPNFTAFMNDIHSGDPQQLSNKDVGYTLVDEALIPDPSQTVEQTFAEVQNPTDDLSEGTSLVEQT